jgi:hypothetical protein
VWSVQRAAQGIVVACGENNSRRAVCRRFVVTRGRTRGHCSDLTRAQARRESGEKAAALL